MLDRNRRLTLVLLALVAMLYTAITIQYALHYGRLALPVGYDDIVYFEDALSRLTWLYTHGLAANPTSQAIHAPLTTAMAMFGFATFGWHDWAPYAVNSLVILAMLMLLNRLLAGLHPVPRVLLLAYSLTLPFVNYSITEFRPDLPAGLATAAALILLVTRPFVGSRRQTWTLGLLFGLVLLAKPTATPFNLVMLGTSLMAAGLRERYLSREHSSGIILRQALAYLGIAVLVASPYYYLYGTHVVQYLQNTLAPDYRAIVTYGTDWSLKLPMYVTGVYGARMLGTHLVALLLLACGGGLVAAVRNGRRQGADFAILAGMTILAWFIPSYLGMGNPFFGATFYFMLLFMAILGARQILVAWETRPPVLLAAILLVAGILLWAAGTNRVPGQPVQQHADLARSANQVGKALYDLLSREPLDKEVRVYFTVTGFINDSWLRYEFLKQGRSVPVYQLFTFKDDPTEWRDLRDRARYVFACEPGLGGLGNEGFPSGKRLAEALALVREDPHLQELAAFPVHTGSRCFLFKREPPPGG